jgi:hypothetical protein
VPGVPGECPGRDVAPGQRLDLGVQQRLVLLHDRDVVRLLGLDQPLQVGAHRVECVERDHQTSQVQAVLQSLQQFGEVAGLVVFHVDLDLVEQAPAVRDDTEQVDPGAVSAAGAPGGLPVHRHGADPVTGQRFRPRGTPPGPVLTHGAGRGPVDLVTSPPSPRREQRPPQSPRVEMIQHDPDRLLIRDPIRPGQRIPRRPQPSQVALTDSLDPLTDPGQPVVTGRGQRAHRDRDQTRQRVDQPLPGARIGQSLQPRPRIDAKEHPGGVGLDHTCTRTRQCPSRHDGLPTTTASTPRDLHPACLHPPQRHAATTDPRETDIPGTRRSLPTQLSRRDIQESETSPRPRPSHLQPSFSWSPRSRLPERDYCTVREERYQMRR